MTTTPDGISFSDLQDLMEEAPKDAEIEAPRVTDRDELNKIAADALDAAATQAKGPMVHKVMVAMIITNMIDWHTSVGQQMFDDGEIESGTAWLRDGGKCQAIMNLLFEIQCGEDDFLGPQ